MGKNRSSDLDNARKKFKQSVAYKKPSRVTPYEKSGSSYRAKLRARQQGISDGSVHHDFELSEGTFKPVAKVRPKSEPKFLHHQHYDASQHSSALFHSVLVTESFNGPASRETYLENGHLDLLRMPPVALTSLAFKPCFLVAEAIDYDFSRHENDGEPTWCITRYTGFSDPGGEFNGDTYELLDTIKAPMPEMVTYLKEWCQRFGGQPSTMKNYLFPEALKVTSKTEPHIRLSSLFGFKYGW